MMTTPEIGEALKIGAKAQELLYDLNGASGDPSYVAVAINGTLSAVAERLLDAGDLEALRLALAQDRPEEQRLAGVVEYLLGRGDVATLRLVVDRFAAIDAEERQRQADDEERWRAAYAESVRRHELAIQVECPFCGAQPGEVCRTTGPSGKRQPKGVHDHRGRYRAATGTL